MTILVGIASRDGIVVGADSSATSAAPGQLKTIEKPTRKISIVGERVIVATTGAIGMAQRLISVVDNMYGNKAFQADAQQCARSIASDTLKDLQATFACPANQQTGLPNVQVGALVGMLTGDGPRLVEFEVGSFQPEFKDDNNWYVAMGGGQLIVDPFLALLSRCFCEDGQPPDLPTAKFMTAWALEHACAVNPGGIKEPYHLAVIDRGGSRWHAHDLTEEEVLEHSGMIEEAYKHIGRFTDQTSAPDLPAVEE